MLTSQKSNYILEKIADWPKGFKRPKIIEGGLSSAKHYGEYDTEANTIRLRTGLSPELKSQILRHELTHAIRSSQNKASLKYYDFLPMNIAEETAAFTSGVARIKEFKGLPPKLRRTAARTVGVIAGPMQAVYQRPIQSIALAGAAAYLGARALKKHHEKKASIKPLVIAGVIGAGIGFSAGPKIKENLTYGTYLAKHKYNVIPPMRGMGLGWGQAFKHDLSKLSPAEFGPYRNWFAGPKGITGTRDPETFKNWRTAVQHHYHAPGNLHHYRALGLDQSTVPLKYRMEAVADWYSVQKTKGATNEHFTDWYKRLRTKLPIASDTQAAIDQRLGLDKKAFVDAGLANEVMGFALGGAALHVGQNIASNLFMKSQTGRKALASMSRAGFQHGMQDKKMAHGLFRALTYGAGPEFTADYQIANRIGRQAAKVIQTPEISAAANQFSKVPAIVAQHPEEVKALRNFTKKITVTDVAHRAVTGDTNKFIDKLLGKIKTVPFESKPSVLQNITHGAIGAAAAIASPEAAAQLGVNALRQGIGTSSLGRKFLKHQIEKGMNIGAGSKTLNWAKRLMLSPRAAEARELGAAIRPIRKEVTENFSNFGL
jgi:hypothetical protein